MSVVEIECTYIYYLDIFVRSDDIYLGIKDKWINCNVNTNHHQLYITFGAIDRLCGDGANGSAVSLYIPCLKLMELRCVCVCEFYYNWIRTLNMVVTSRLSISSPQNTINSLIENFNICTNNNLCFRTFGKCSHFHTRKFIFLLIIIKHQRSKPHKHAYRNA